MARTISDKSGGSGSGGVAHLGASAGRLSRWALLAIWSVLTLWSVCLWIISGQALGCSWAGMVEAAAAELLALAVALALPDFFMRLIFALAMRFRPSKALALQVVLTARGGSPAAAPARAGMGVLALASAACAAGGLASSFGVSFAAEALRWLGSVFLFPAWAWAAVRVLVAVVLMLPIAVPAAGVIQIASLLHRQGPGGAVDWLMRRLPAAAAGGLIMASALWWAGVNLLGVAFGCAAALVAVAAWVATGGQGSLPAPAAVPRAGPWQRRRPRGSNLLIWAVVGCVVTLQCRALRDAAGADWALSWLWLAYTVGVAAAAWRRVSASGRKVSAADAAGAACGGVLIAVMQLGLLVFAAADGGGRWVWIAVVAAGQIPFAALWVTVLVWRSRCGGEAGCPPRPYMGDAAGGLAVGAYLAMVMLAWPASGRTLAIAALTCLTGVFLAGAQVAGRADQGSGRRLGRQLRWAGAAAASILSAAVVFTGGVRSGRAVFGSHVVIGASLTAYQTPAGQVEVLGRLAPVGEDGRLTELARQLIRSRPGRWWVVPGRRPELLGGLGEGVRLSVFFGDRAIGRLAAYRGAGEPAEFLRYLNAHSRLVDGIYLGGLRADHPDAWCLYNQDVLERCLEQVAPGGVMILHVSAHEASLGRVLAVAKTFSAAAGDAKAAVVVAPSGLEVLLVSGPLQGHAAAALAGAKGVAVLSAAELVEANGGRQLRAISLLAPRRRGRGQPSLSDLAQWLDQRRR